MKSEFFFLRKILIITHDIVSGSLRVNIKIVRPRLMNFKEVFEVIFSPGQTHSTFPTPRVHVNMSDKKSD